MSQKFVVATFNGYTNAGGYAPDRHHYEVTVFVKPDTQFSIKLRDGYGRDTKKCDQFNGVILVVNDKVYELVDNYNETVDKISAALNQVL